MTIFFSDISPMYARLEGRNMPKRLENTIFLGVLANNFLKIDCIKNLKVHIENSCIKEYICVKILAVLLKLHVNFSILN